MSLFDPIRIGGHVLPNRVFMAPLTRGRADSGGVPNELMARYYTQRATAGLIVAEATAVSRQGDGWPGAPGIYTAAQVAGWKKVTGAVRRAGGRMFLQIFHMGRTVLPEYAGGAVPVSASAVRASGEMPGRDGVPRPFAVPRALGRAEIAAQVADFVRAAEYAMDAGFDGVEIHAANDFLIDSFLRDGTNRRYDDYGGSTENRSRFLMEITRAIVAKIGAGKTAVRISPTNAVFGIADSDPAALFITVARQLSSLRLAYLHVLEPPANSGHFMANSIPEMKAVIRDNYTGTLVLNGGFDRERGNRAIATGAADAIAFGTPFIANPDLVARLAHGWPLATPDPSTFYTPGSDGYIDYPARAEELAG